MADLRGYLLLLAAGGADPVAELLAAAAERELASARDQAAVLDSRIHDINEVGAGGPLPWLPGIPDHIAADPNWGPYRNARSRLVAQHADQIRTNAAVETPAWAAKRHAPVPAKLIAHVQVWRAATQVDTNDLRPNRATPSSATPPEPGNSNSTRDSHPRRPIQIGNRGGCSPQKSLK